MGVSATHIHVKFPIHATRDAPTAEILTSTGNGRELTKKHLLWKPQKIRQAKATKTIKALLVTSQMNKKASEEKPDEITQHETYLGLTQPPNSPKALNMNNSP